MARRERERNRCRERIEALADASLDADEARLAAVDALRRGVGFDRWCWPLTDPATGLSTSGIGEFDFAPSLPRLVALEEHGDVSTKPSLFAGRRASIALSDATGGDLSRSPRWRECLQPYGIGDELMTACRDRHGWWGSLELMRDAADEPFGAEDARLLHDLSPLLAALLRRGPLTARRPCEPAPERLAPATLILDRELAVLSWTPSLQPWLRVLPAVPGTMPPAVYEIGARALAASETPAAVLNRVRIPTFAGGFAVLEGALLEGAQAGHVAITVRDATAAEVFDLLARTYALTPRERELVALTLEGLGTKQLAQALRISPYTVQDHLKSVFAKTGTRTRGELVSELTGGVSAAA